MYSLCKRLIFFHNLYTLLLLFYCSLYHSCSIYIFFFCIFKKTYKNKLRNFNILLQKKHQKKKNLLKSHLFIYLCSILAFSLNFLIKSSLSKSIFIGNKGIEAVFIDFLCTYSHGVNWLLNISYICPPFVNVLYNVLFIEDLNWG